MDEWCQNWGWIFPCGFFIFMMMLCIFWMFGPCRGWRRGYYWDKRGDKEEGDMRKEVRELKEAVKELTGWIQKLKE